MVTKVVVATTWLADGIVPSLRMEVETLDIIGVAQDQHPAKHFHLLVTYYSSLTPSNYSVTLSQHETETTIK